MSPRPKCLRKVRGISYPSGFRPLESDGTKEEPVALYVEEFEAIYLCDHEGKLQAEAAESMGVSRPTLTRIYASARRKIADALVGGKRLIVEGGVSFTDAEWYRCGTCGLVYNKVIPTRRSSVCRCPSCNSVNAVHFNPDENSKNKINMKKIALPARNGQIDDHFGHCEFYAVLTIGDDNKIIEYETIPSPQGCGCKSDIAFRLQEKGVTLMLAGNMGEGALRKLASCNIEVIRGCSGPILTVAADYLSGKIKDSGESCRHDCREH